VDPRLRAPCDDSAANIGATDWIAPNCPLPDGSVESRRTPIRLTSGAISRRSSSHFPPMLYSKVRNPVALVPGRARLSTNPRPTGSATMANTIGIALVSSSKTPTVAPVANMTSGASATSSAAYLRRRSASPPLQRYSTCRLSFSVQPNCCSPCRNAARPVCASGSSVLEWHQHTDAPHSFGLLRARRKRPYRRQGAHRFDEIASSHYVPPRARLWPISVAPIS